MANPDAAILAWAGDASSSTKPPATKKQGRDQAGNKRYATKRITVVKEGKEPSRSSGFFVQWNLDWKDPEEARVTLPQKKRKAATAELDARMGKSAREKKLRGWTGVGEESGHQCQRPQAPGCNAKAAARAAPEPGSSKLNGESEPPTWREIDVVRIGRSDLAQVCFYLGFEEAAIGCLVRGNSGPAGRNICKLARLQRVVAGPAYAVEDRRRQQDVTT
ncbi:MAG: hypothetical protein M1826_004149 [Phylliscum demangeonii]|nr:MAG: hypothetical protein M1826_004149 [Phylliscum demangeonii]